MFSRRAAAYIQGSDCVRSRTESGSGTLYVLRPRTAHHNGANHYGLASRSSQITHLFRAYPPLCGHHTGLGRLSRNVRITQDIRI